MDLMGTFGKCPFSYRFGWPRFFQKFTRRRISFGLDPRNSRDAESPRIGSSLRRGKKRTPRGKSAEKNEEFLVWLWTDQFVFFKLIIYYIHGNLHMFFFTFSATGKQYIHIHILPYTLLLQIVYTVYSSYWTNVLNFHWKGGLISFKIQESNQKTWAPVPMCRRAFRSSLPEVCFFFFCWAFKHIMPKKTNLATKSQKKSLESKLAQLWLVESPTHILGQC